jgi:hypothetical protein
LKNFSVKKLSGYHSLLPDLYQRTRLLLLLIRRSGWRIANRMKRIEEEIPKTASGNNFITPVAWKPAVKNSN